MKTLNRCFVVGSLAAFVGLLTLGELSPWRQQAVAQPEPHQPTELDAVVDHAIAAMIPIGGSGAAGLVHFRMMGDKLRIQGQLSGLEPGLYGFHIHQYGDLSDRKSGRSVGDQFHPTGEPHGRHEVGQRHVGDLESIKVGDTGEVTLEIEVDRMDLEGPFSILGRSIVVHSGPDKFTQPDGAAGEHVAIGLIGLANPNFREFRQTRMEKQDKD